MDTSPYSTTNTVVGVRRMITNDVIFLSTSYPLFNCPSLPFTNSRIRITNDINFLGDIIYPKIQEDIFAHDAYSCARWPNSHPFPTPRIWTYHIGQVYDSNERGRDNDIQIIRNAGQEAPACQPKWPFT